MLTDLSIRNFAIIDQLELEFGQGLTVLTGETGAGKSIMFDALQLALGGRADATVVRHDCQRAEVVASFDIGRFPALVDWLQQHDLEHHSELLLRRVVTAEGRSRAYINGTPVPVQKLRGLGQQLMEIHGQNEHQNLQKPANQLALLDAAAKSQQHLRALAACYGQWREQNGELERLRAETALSAAEQELLEYQAEELNQQALAPAELEAIEVEHRLLNHAGELITATDNAVEMLNGENGGICDALARAVQTIAGQSAIDQHLQEARQLMDDALIQVQEAGRALARHRDRIEVNPERLAQLDQQISEIDALARKHRVQAEDLSQKRDQIQQRLQTAAHSAEREQQLLKLIETSSHKYRSKAEELFGVRSKAATSLAKSVTALMGQLGMEGGRLEVQVKHDAERPFRPNGQDEVQFLVSANPGLAPKTLSRVASGGELSRISLAIKVALIGSDDPVSMIFDEVDSGIGGAVAQIVGQKLRAVAAQRQVFCVTHLPQVAACGHLHYRVSKKTTAESGVTTEVRQLDEEQRVAEIARMLGGLKITEQTTAHARQMIQTTQQ